MIWHALIAHAPGEEKLAEKLARPLQDAGYEVSYRGTVLVGESFAEEAGKALNAPGPVIVCATIKALGTGWAHRLVHAAQAKGDEKRIFAVRMEEGAYLGQVAAGLAVAEYWRDPVRGIQDLLMALRKHFPLEPAGSPVINTEIPLMFLDRLTGVSRFDREALSRFRSELRANLGGRLSPDLSDMEFLQRSSLMREGFLTLTGVLLFGETPTDLLPSAFSRCVDYAGPTKAADRQPMEIRGTVVDQITGLYRQITSHIPSRERVRLGSPQAEIIYQYPMKTIREIIANALVHRDYEDSHRSNHVRLFSDRIEILSPGDWIGGRLPADGEARGLGELISESVKRNLRLATVVSWIRLVEGEGSGLPTAIEECREISAPEPRVSFQDGFIKVTIFPRNDWRGTDVPIASQALTFLHQLPSPPADFVGRAKELADLQKGLTHNDAAGVLIQGIGGIGKTSLALKLAHNLMPSYPDGQIFLDLKGASREPLLPSSIMAHVIRSFHPQARIPAAEPELTALYRSILHERRVLLVLDNAGDAEQIAVLLPPPESSLLVTSRIRFSLPGFFSLTLEPLSAEEARELLVRLVPRIGAAADEIGVLCGYLPLAIRLAGAFLADRPDLSPEDYIGLLKEGYLQGLPEGQGAVEASIRFSYEMLTSEQRELWLTLSVFPSSFDRAAASAVLDLDDGATGRHLGVFLRIGMLAWENGRYRSHLLLRAFAESVLEPSAGAAARKRHARYYLQILGKTSSLYEQGGDSVRQGLALFDQEWENFQAGYSWAAAHSSEDEEIARMCSAYPHAGAYCLDLRLSPHERIQWFESALTAARHLGDRTAAAIHLGNLGNAFMNQGQYDKAILLYQEWLETTQATGDRRGTGQALGNLGNAYHSLGGFPRAIELFEECLRIARELGDRRGEGMALGNLASAFKSLGDLGRATDLYEQRLTIAREIGDLRGEAIALGNLGNTIGAQGNLHRAAEYFEECLKIARGLGDRRSEGIALCSLGDANAALGYAERALELYHQAQPILQDVDDWSGDAEIVGLLGKVQHSSEPL